MLDSLLVRKYSYIIISPECLVPLGINFSTPFWASYPNLSSIILWPTTRLSLQSSLADLQQPTPQQNRPASHISLSSPIIIWPIQSLLSCSRAPPLSPTVCPPALPRGYLWAPESDQVSPPLRTLLSHLSHLAQRKSPAPFCGPQGLCDPPLSPPCLHLLPLSFLITLLRSQGPPLCSSYRPGTACLQGLCTDTSLCLEDTSSAFLMTTFLTLLRSSNIKLLFYAHFLT